MELSELRQVLPADQPAYRAAQVYRAIYRQKVGDLVQISTLPASVRAELAARAELGLPELDRRYESADGTRRYLLRLSDGRTVETVLMPEGDRDTVCMAVLLFSSPELELRRMDLKRPTRCQRQRTRAGGPPPQVLRHAGQPPHRVSRSCMEEVRLMRRKRNRTQSL